MSRFFHLLLIPVIISLAAGCAPGQVVSPGKATKAVQPPQVVPVSVKVAQSRLPRAAGQVSEADRRALAEGNSAFAFDLYHKIAAGDQNVFYSPYSISLALAMAYAGARGETAQQMAAALHFNLPAGQLHPAINALDQELAKRKDAGGQGADSKGFRLNIVNDLWGQQDAAFQQAYLDLLAQDYGSGLRLMDFQNNPEGARKTINDYIAQKTENRIQNLVPAGAIDSLTRLVLTNAIYFNAAWMYRFDSQVTKNAPFTRLDGSKVDVSMMSQPMFQSLSYGAGNDYQAVALPYEGGSLSMLVLVPDQGKFKDFEAGLDSVTLANILQKMGPAEARVSLPRFNIEAGFDLKKTLSGLGMSDAFTPGSADFSGIDGTRELYIGDVVHKAFVKVNEDGTEAAAATMIAFPAMGIAGETKTLVVDRPFIFLIRDEPTNTILFVGKVMDPAK